MHDSVQLPSREQVLAKGLGKPALVALAAGLVGLLATVALGAGHGDGFSHFGHSMLVAILVFLGITLGSLVFILIHHVTSAGWSVVVRRVAEGVTGAFPVMGVLVLAVLAVPAFLGSGYVYDWADSEFAASHELVQHKSPYLNGTFFLVRVLVYFTVWMLLTRFFVGRSLRQDDDQDPRATLSMQRRAGVSIIAFALTLTFCFFDLSMSLNAEWFSTMYGVYMFAGAFWSFLAALVLLAMWLEKRGPLKGVVTIEHYHDIGKLLFAFTFFWSYVAFSQFMLYWYGDIPEETRWFLYRMYGDWQGLSLVLLIGHFLIPMLGLLSRHVKRNRAVLASWAVYCLVFHFVDMYWNVMPELRNGLGGSTPDTAGTTFHLMDVTALLGVGGVWLFAVLKRLDGKPAVAIGDPRLSESLAFENI